MWQFFKKSLILLLALVIIIGGIYPFALWLIGQTFFPFQANGSLLFISDNKKPKAIGSKLIAQSFTAAKYFHPRPSAASYDASASASSSLAASNYALRDRVARLIGSIVKYQDGHLAAPDIEQWFQQDKYQGNPHIVAQWASRHPALARAWINADPGNQSYVRRWAKTHSSVIAQYWQAQPHSAPPKLDDLAIVFFQNFSEENPGKFPKANAIPVIFFDMWRQDHPDAVLQNIPSDSVTTSASGLDPHITMQNAEYQLDRVATQWAQDLKRDPEKIKVEIQHILQQNVFSPLHGLVGEPLVNVLEVNLALHARYETGK